MNLVVNIGIAILAFNAFGYMIAAVTWIGGTFIRMLNLVALFTTACGWASIAAGYQMVEHFDAARHEVKLMKETNANVSFAQFRATMAFKDPTALDFFFDALRRAGFEG